MVSAHARELLGARPASCALRTGQGVAARRLRHRHAPRRSASDELEGARRRDRASKAAMSSPRRQGSRGGRVELPKVSVGATHNALMAAVLAARRHSDRERGPRARIADVADCLEKMGAEIEVSAARPWGSGRGHLDGAEHTVLARSHRDRHLRHGRGDRRRRAVRGRPPELLKRHSTRLR